LPSLCFLHSRCARRPLPSFPTRRSSDLLPVLELAGLLVLQRPAVPGEELHQLALDEAAVRTDGERADLAVEHVDARRDRGTLGRSEEHTSELQSRENLVCRLLLEKKKSK